MLLLIRYDMITSRPPDQAARLSSNPGAYQGIYHLTVCVYHYLLQGVKTKDGFSFFHFMIFARLPPQVVRLRSRFFAEPSFSSSPFLPFCWCRFFGAYMCA